MKPRLHVFFMAALTLLAALPVTARAREKMRLYNNTNATPQEIVRYFVSRDAEGQVWSGLYTRERELFTFWKENPHTEMFWVADSFEILPDRTPASMSDTTTVRVLYRGVTRMQDAYGAYIPVQDTGMTTRTVAFQLRRVDGLWKIESPTSAGYEPILLRSHLPSH